MSASPIIPRISVTMVAFTSDSTTERQILADPIQTHSQQHSQKHVPPKIHVTPAESTIWYDEESSSSSSDSESDEEDDENSISPQEEPYRATHLTPPPTMLTHPLRAGALKSPCSPLRMSYTPPVQERETSPSSGSLPEDKKGLDKDRFAGLLRASRERRVSMSMNMRVQTTGLKSPSATAPKEQQLPPITVTSPRTRHEIAPAPSSARRSMDLRKEITLRAHVAKHEERRQTFLARLLATPSSSPTTLTTPVTPPDSPAEFHFTLPSPGLVSPLALFETIANGEYEDEEDENGDAYGFDRVEKVNWAQEVNAKKYAVLKGEYIEQEPRSPVARVGGMGMGMSIGMGMDSIMRQQPQVPAQKAAPAPTRLPIGVSVGRLQIPNTGRRLTPAPTPTVTVTPAESNSKVIVPPRRGASLLHPTPSPAAPSPSRLSTGSTVSSSRPGRTSPPSLTEITARLSASKTAAAKAAAATPTWGGNVPRSRASLSPLIIQGSNAQAAPRSNARSAAFPDFLRQRQQQQQALDVSKPAVPAVTMLADPSKGAVQPRHKDRDASVLVVPPSRPKSVDALQERLARGNAMKERLANHQRRKSDSGVPADLPRALPAAHRAGPGWF